MAEAKHRDPNVPAKWTDLPVEVLHLIFGELFRDYEASYPVVELHDQDHDEVEHHENSDDGMEPRENNYYETELHTKLQYSSGRLHMVIPTPYCFAVCKSYLEAARSFVLNYSFVELRLFDLYFSQIREIVLCPDFNEIRYLKVPYAQELAVTVQAVIDAAPSLKMLVLDVGQREFGFNHLRTMLDVDEEPIAPEFDDKETTKIAQDFAAVIVTAFIVARYKDGTLFGNAIESWLKRDKEFDFCMDFTTEKSHLAEVEEFSWGHGSIHWIWKANFNASKMEIDIREPDDLVATTIEPLATGLTLAMDPTFWQESLDGYIRHQKNKRARREASSLSFVTGERNAAALGVLG